MRRVLLSTAVVAVLAVPATANAAVRHVIRGAGWGHGIGMSQYGAYGYAREGTGYRAILAHYYTAPVSCRRRRAPSGCSSSRMTGTSGCAAPRAPAASG